MLSPAGINRSDASKCCLRGAHILFDYSKHRKFTNKCQTGLSTHIMIKYPCTFPNFFMLPCRPLHPAQILIHRSSLLQLPSSHVRATGLPSVAPKANMTCITHFIIRRGKQRQEFEVFLLFPMFTFPFPFPFIL